VNERISDAEIGHLQRLLASATDGPWFVTYAQDPGLASATVVTTSEYRNGVHIDRDIDRLGIVAVTLVHNPYWYGIGDDKWDINAELIALLRNVGPRLLAELLELRANHPAGNGTSHDEEP
jgi:hypothetical protein